LGGTLEMSLRALFVFGRVQQLLALKVDLIHLVAAIISVS